MIGIATSDGTPTIPLFVDAGGYVEISASAYPAPPGVTQGNNRFVAQIAVTGTNLNSTSFDLILNVVSDDINLWNLQFGELGGDPPTWQILQGAASFQAGQSLGTEISWFASNIPSLYPPNQADYPIYFVAGPDAGAGPPLYGPGGGSGGPGGSGILVPGQLFMSPPSLVAWWTGPAGSDPGPTGHDAGVLLKAYSTVFAYPFAPSVEDGSFSVLQSLYNFNLTSQSSDVTNGYSITATPPVV
jgi:hypothetical protein